MNFTAEIFLLHCIRQVTVQVLDKYYNKKSNSNCHSGYLNLVIVQTCTKLVL